MYCVKCGTELPEHANYCLECGAAQRTIIETRAAIMQMQVRAVARGASALAGLFFLVMFLSEALHSSFPVWDDISFWAAIAGIMALIAVPQIIWREKPSEGIESERYALQKQRSWVLMSGVFLLMLGIGLFMFWGFRFLGFTSWDGPVRLKVMVLALMSANIAFVITIARVLDRSQAKLMDWSQARLLAVQKESKVIVAIVVIGLAANAIGELLWRMNS